jgi:opacity protein-like surface antigen
MNLRSFNGFVLVLAFALALTATMATAQTTTEQITSTPAAQQPRKLSLGVYGAFNLDQHTANFTDLPGDVANAVFYPRTAENPGPGNFTGGSASGVAFGIVGEYKLLPELSVGLRVSYAEQRTQFRTTYSQAYGVLNSAGDRLIDGTATSEYLLQTAIAVLGLEPLASYNVWDNLSVYLGARVGLALSGKFNQSENIVSVTAGGVNYNNNSKTRNKRDGVDLPDLQTVQVSGVVGLGYEIPVTPRFVVAPEAFYSIGFLPVIKNLSWNVNTLRAGVSLKYKF